MPIAEMNKVPECRAFAHFICSILNSCLHLFAEQIIWITPSVIFFFKRQLFSSKAVNLQCSVPSNKIWCSVRLSFVTKRHDFKIIFDLTLSTRCGEWESDSRQNRSETKKKYISPPRDVDACYFVLSKSCASHFVPEVRAVFVFVSIALVPWSVWLRSPVCVQYSFAWVYVQSRHIVGYLSYSVLYCQLLRVFATTQTHLFNLPLFVDGVYSSHTVPFCARTHRGIPIFDLFVCTHHTDTGHTLP